MALDGNGGSRSGSAEMRKSGGWCQTFKKGPWTAVEDSILMEYVKEHGERNWNSVQRNSGLVRCGKSCRLRWVNHLRPNLKRGTFSDAEERLIVELHAKFGNKWARMAAQLPGRTDNEIKNFWNTRVKRHQRAGLPIYPHDIQPKDHHHQRRQPNHHQRERNSASSSLSSLLSPQSHHRNSLPNSNHQFKLFRDNNGGLALALTSPTLPFPSSSATLFNPGLSTEAFNSFNYNNDGLVHESITNEGSKEGQIYRVLSPHVERLFPHKYNNLRPNIGASFNPNISSVSRMGIGLPSIQSPVLTSTGSEYLMATSNEADEYEIAPEFSQGNCGLLEDLLLESQALTSPEIPKKEKFAAENEDKWKYISEHGIMEDKTAALQVDSSFVHSSIAGMKRKKPQLEEMNYKDEYFLNLLDNFPMTVPVPDWDDKSPRMSNGVPWNMDDGNVGINNNREVPHSPVATASAMPDHDWALGSCCWNNLPSICEDQS